jgi:hypothetical protein
MTISKPVITIIIHNGKNPPNTHNVFFKNIIHVNKDNIFNNVCPDIKFANNLIAKLNTLAK